MQAAPTPVWRRILGVVLVVVIVNPLIAGPGDPSKETGTNEPPKPRPVPEYPRDAVVAATAPIMLPGEGGVTDSGAATYTLPLRVPAGPRGMQPRLALAYDSSGGSGSLGVGMALSGLSSIAPCHKAFASEGTADGVDFDATDVYCLDGKKLVIDTRAPGTWRTEVDNQERILREHAGAVQPVSFTVKRADGTIATYKPIRGKRKQGIDAYKDPQVVSGPDQVDVAITYPIHEVVDRDGNVVRYVYEVGADSGRDPDAVSYRLQRIDYSAKALTVPRRRVVFHYESRPDVLVRYIAGVKVVSTSRIAKIEMQAPNPHFTATVWTYYLAYELGAESKRSRLAGVTLCEPGGQCSWQRSFRWSTASAALVDHVVSSSAEFDARSWSRDAASWEDYAATWIDEHGNQHYTYPEVRWTDPTDVRLVVYDADGDGRDDILYRTQPTKFRYGEERAVRYGIEYIDQNNQYTKGTIKLRRSTTGLLNEVTDVSDYVEPTESVWPGGYGVELWQAHLGKSRVADLDGDGRLDMLLARTLVQRDGYWQHPADAGAGNDIASKDRWYFGYTNVGPFTGTTWDLAKRTQLARSSIWGPVFRDSSWDPARMNYLLATPAFQHVFADLDGDGKTDDVDAFYYKQPVDVVEQPLGWFDSEAAVIGGINYETRLSSDIGDDMIPWTFLQDWIPGQPVARWSCNNGRAMITDYEGDGRDDVLVMLDDDGDAVHGAFTYGRLHTDDAHFGSPRRGSTKSDPAAAVWAGDCGQHQPNVLLGDWNGDGLEDILYPPRAFEDAPPESPPNPERPQVRWNLGNGYGPLEPLLADDPALEARLYGPQPQNRAGLPVGWDRGTRVVDLDGDGRSDILALRHEDPNSYTDPKILIAYLSAGDHFVARKLATWQDAETSLAEGFTTFQVGDVTGDGAVDAVHVESGKIVVTELPWRKRGDQLLRVEDEGAAFPLEVFRYDSAWWGGGPRPGAAACAYPVECIRRGFEVVRSHAVFQGVAADGSPRYRDHLHSYADPRRDLRGRGFLGFAEHRIWDRATGTEVLRKLNNSHHVDHDELGGKDFYPLAGVVWQTITTIPQLPLPSAAELSGTNLPGATGNEYTLATRTIQTTYSHELRWAESGHVLTRLLATTTTVERDIDATATDLQQAVPRYTWWGEQGDRRVTRTETVHDDFGYPVTTSRARDDGTIELVSTTYDRDQSRVDDWLLGLATRVERRSAADPKAPGVPAQVVRTDYDAAGHPKLRRWLAEADPSCTSEACEIEARRADYGYDSVHGNLERVTLVAVDEPDPRETRFEHDAEGVYPTQTVDARHLTTTSLLHPALGLPILDVDANGVTTTRTYDGFGRLVQLAPQGAATISRTHVETTVGAQRGLKVTTSGSDGSEAYARTDELGREVETGVKSSGTEWSYRHHEYDHFGNRHRTSSPSNATTPTTWATTHYDRLGRVIEQVGFDGATVEHEHAMFRTTTRDAENHVTYERRDVNGRVVESGHEVPEAYGEVKFLYGPFDRVDAIVDAAGNVTSRSYDAFGRLEKLEDPDRGTMSLAHNGFDEVILEEHAGAETLRYRYDTLGRVLEIADGNTIESRTYDLGTGGAHRLSSATSLDGVITDLAYDTLGRTLEIRQQLDGVSHSIHHRYDSAGRLQYLLYPAVAGFDRFKLKYSYQYGHLSEIRDASPCAIPADPTIAPPACTGKALWKITDRDARLAPTAATLGNGFTEERVRDPDTGRIERLVAAGRVIDYSYDADGNLASRIEGAHVEKFGYDPLHRLTSWTLQAPRRRDGTLPPPVTTAYDYDELGNLERVTRDASAIFHGTFGTEGRPHALDTTLAGDTFEYDARGRQRTAGDKTIVWNSRSRPAEIKAGDLRRFRYDAFGNRASQERDTGPSITYMGRLYEQRADRHTFLVHGDPGVVAQIDYEGGKRSTRYLIADPLGSPSVIMQGSTIVERPHFDPFGARVDQAGNAAGDADPHTTLGFTGREEDDGDLVNLGGRIYDRSQYRFLSPDPIVANVRSGQAHNPYSYVLNNPLRYTDPSGFVPEDDYDDAEILDSETSNSGKSYYELRVKKQCSGDGCTDADPADDSGGVATDDGGANDNDNVDYVQQAYEQAEQNRRNDGTGGAPNVGEHADAYVDIVAPDAGNGLRHIMRDTFESSNDYSYSSQARPLWGLSPDLLAGGLGFGPFNVEITVSRYWDVYFTSSGDFYSLMSQPMSQWSTPGFHVYDEWLLQEDMPTPGEIDAFMCGPSTTFDGGHYGMGAGFTRADGKSTGTVLAVGARTSGVGGGRAFTWKLDIQGHVRNWYNAQGATLENGGGIHFVVGY